MKKIALLALCASFYAAQILTSETDTKTIAYCDYPGGPIYYITTSGKPTRSETIPTSIVRESTSTPSYNPFINDISK